uniref:Uncharacterized protein n=1 Tax=Zea mays TaxID=4577 RepID=B7ZZH7_MAIZE|nr:unknown [Zea mays]|eukprot:NP_001146132.1 uncharacterized protein LOC100279696 [Zea mays]
MAARVRRHARLIAPISTAQGHGDWPAPPPHAISYSPYCVPTLCGLRAHGRVALHTAVIDQRTTSSSMAMALLEPTTSDSRGTRFRPSYSPLRCRRRHTGQAHVVGANPAC